ncbi:23S rRNA (uracil(747)-C(5))-methyltransferase RlmC [Shewanella pealeana]|uniref:23S rRNA (uracil(747)-C(5))-methyltransferase RlmC n=1 Tax=Shewanella pealeana (strain ATCC 700345 / ANG-SQ1) TaxID=398579 RepID=RLMC_SHEPA|nr:23S rRNA (uracil(747)-C(5))-methyltransferase RlmC [Shewanella pealeana]A8H8Q9.2 RecName: Full=23S rRNA (uracil(747)-C(5))-methyltransferase RlmC; AltName: Full=23S rRNA(m5U747)-methyltransferase [Shewanella pealeana ATCC 700345]
MKCAHFDQQQCLSCRHIKQSMSVQVAAKSQVLSQLLSDFEVEQWHEPVFGPDSGFRNKAKMVVLGAAHQPILGIVTPTGEPVSLCDCNLYPEDMQLLLHRLEQFVRQAGIPPYNVDKAKGELKFILLTRSQIKGEYLLRFVLKSHKSIERIERELPKLLSEYPQIKVVSVNIQPVHMAILEGEEEIFLTEETRLSEQFNDVPLFIRPKSFFQTHPQIAAKLYQTAREWVAELKPSSLWDLFCGVGGFGLHCASKTIPLTGIEISSEAIACAKISAETMGLTQVDFTALDSTGFAQGCDATDKPDVVIVNPPRRGIGESLCQSLSDFAPKAILYSSCNPHTLAKDLANIQGYHIQKVQLFDMFPHTDHFEVLVMLVKPS